MRTLPFAALTAAACIAGCLPALAQDQPVPDHECTVDLELAGNMKDIVSNALVLGLGRQGTDVHAFLVDAEMRYATGPDLLTAAAAHFKIERAVLSAEVERFKHCNCGVGGSSEAARVEDGVKATAFAKDVTLHVVLHELGHALIREFDIPVLGNEETVADAFATYYLTTCMPDRAVAVLEARTRSLMIEAAEDPGSDWTGEHDHDGRRAFKIAAIAIAADPVKYKPVADAVGMTAEDIQDATDYGSEVHRSWRRVLSPLWMPEGMLSTEARVVCDDSPFITSLCVDGLAAEVEGALRRFDWHSQITVRFASGDGGAGWSRSNRTVTVNSAYAHRFVEQGAKADPN